MPRRRRVYILRIEDYLVDPPSPPSRAPRIILFAACGALAMANLLLFFSWLFSLISPNALEVATFGVVAYAVVLVLFVSLARGINHVE